jgi:ribonuclease P protein component
LIRGITRRATFERLRREGVRVRRPTLGVTYAPIGDSPQVAFAISRKVGGAVVRNRSRRRVRAILAERHHAGRLAPGAYLVHVTAPLDAVPFTDLHDVVDQVFDALDERVAAA